MIKPIFIGEVKLKSPYGFQSPYKFATLWDYAEKHADWISIHTDPRFGGSFDDIYFAKRRTRKPILAKGFHCSDDDVKKCFDLGADYVLVVDRFRPNLNKEPYSLLFEISNNKELQHLRRCYGAILDKYKFVYNSRDLFTGNTKEDQWDEFRKKSNWLCGASNIQVKEDVDKFYSGCDAFIVGEHLVKFCNSL
jgi:indole-3-glycerol phosphate synthase